MGILLANLPAFGLPDSAYFSPLPWGGTDLDDRVAWGLNFVLVEGKMRGLFSFLFGASMLLVVQRAAAEGDDPWRVHGSRMAWLFLFGMAHLFLIWAGDILHHYALVGCVAYLFRSKGVRALLWWGAGLVAVQCLLAASVGMTAYAASGAGLAEGFGRPSPDRLTAEIAVLRGGFLDGIAHRLDRDGGNPVALLLFGGAETLGYMLWGMAGLKSGMLTGAWDRRHYLRWAALSLPVGWAAYAAIGWWVASSGFDWRRVVLASLTLSTPIRPLLIVGYACAIVLFARPGGWLVGRIAAAGRAAFTNYLGTSLFMTAVFNGWGLGLFGRIGRADMYWLVPIAWALMLLWSKPWLDRYRYGPLEWAWRSLSRLEPQPMRLSPGRS